MILIQRVLMLLLLTVALTPSVYPALSKQIVYRYDDHRYLVLVGHRCQGVVWYVDNKRNIKTEVTSSSFRLFLKPYIHPSERYIAITDYDASFFYVSRDYGQNFEIVSYAP